MDESAGRLPPPPPPGEPPSDATRRPSQSGKRRPSAAALSTTGSYSRRDGDDLAVAVWALGGPLTLTLMSSIVQAAAAITFCTGPFVAECSGLFAFSVALGVISALLIGFYLLIFVFAKDKLPDKSMLYLSLFLFLWWAAGVGATTFYGAGLSVFFATVSTPYIATWSSFIFSGMVLQSEWEQFATALDNFKALQVHGRATFYVLIASIIETIAAIFVCADVTCYSNEIYAMIVGPISIVICLVFLRVTPEQLGGADKFMAVFLVLWWTCGMGVLTISGPFLLGGNGFFACWAAFLLSFFVAQAKIFPHSDAAVDGP